ncbi:MAG: hypothetical protein NUV90_01460 [Candidatus Parcubacteria bacterium]|nr:hypothetical protein [Candidatus Parcubacteria bacterium]
MEQDGVCLVAHSGGIIVLKDLRITTMLVLLEALYIGPFNYRKTGALVKCYPQEEPEVLEHFDDGRGHSGALSTKTCPLDREVFQEALVREYITGVLEPGYVSKTEFKITEFGIRELSRLHAESEKVVVFTVEQVTALCGGRLPYGDGFTWERVERFELEDGMLQPYAGDTILPGPGIRIKARAELLHDHSRVVHGRSHQTDRYPDGCPVRPD